ncbi:GNAT family N-acetyltransferase [Roseomonas elaeocarpi]|uniref:GNAT family N-acetyltransferase n=1 Tax=Roseomonas elaeocarpi TaxID=907779 RepID=A0ABV6JRR9_9PROT
MTEIATEIASGLVSSVTIRRLVAADAEAFRVLRLAALQGAPDAFGSSPEEAPDLDGCRARLAPPNTVFGAFHRDAPASGAPPGEAGPQGEGTLRGMAGFSRNTGLKQRHKGFLWGVWVDPVLRGTGTGRALVEAVIARARGEVEALQCTVTTGNAVARALYQRLGFVPYGIERRALRVEGRDLDEELLEMDLR